MNIFRPHPDPTDSARSLADRHVIKMALESTQLLSTITGGPYRPTHANHPCTLWAGASRANAAWLLAHGRALCDEYARRFGRVHGCAAVLDAIDLSRVPETAPTAPVYVGPDLGGDTVEERYRRCLAAKYASWGPAARWTGAVRPGWA